MESEKEFDLLRQEFEDTIEERKGCKDEHRSYWIGVTDSRREGDWVLDRGQQEPLDFTAWQDGEPNNYEGKVPGEDCVIVGLWDDETFRWYDVPCGWRSHKSPGYIITNNPFCEQLQGAELEDFRNGKPTGGLESWKRFNASSALTVDAEGEEGPYSYSFLPVDEGVTREEGAAMCREVGGSLAAPSTLQEWSQLKGHIGQVGRLVLGLGNQ